MTTSVINFRQSNILKLPIPKSRPAEMGDRLMFTGNVHHVVLDKFSRIELLEFEEINSKDIVTLSVSQLLRSRGTISMFRKNFDTLGEMLECAIQAKVIFNVTDIEWREVATPNGIRGYKRLHIDCEN